MTSAGPEPTFDAFLSYHSGNRAWVVELRRDLEARGLRIWMDVDGIRPGEHFLTVLERAIVNARCLVLIVSRGSLFSRMVREEFQLALVRQLPIVSVLIEEATPPNGFLSTRTYISFVDPAQRSGNLDSLAAVIRGGQSSSFASADALDRLRGNPTSDAEAISEVEYLNRRIANTEAQARPLRLTRNFAWAAGLPISTALAAYAPSSVGLVFVGELIAPPVVTGLLGWGLTATAIERCNREVAKYENLRDGIQSCIREVSETCSEIHKRFSDLRRQLSLGG